MNRLCSHALVLWFCAEKRWRRLLDEPPRPHGQVHRLPLRVQDSVALQLYSHCTLIALVLVYALEGKVSVVASTQDPRFRFWLAGGAETCKTQLTIKYVLTYETTRRSSLIPTPDAPPCTSHSVGARSRASELPSQFSHRTRRRYCLPNTDTTAIMRPECTIFSRMLGTWRTHIWPFMYLLIFMW